jgi:signal transduction histidine kinase
VVRPFASGVGEWRYAYDRGCGGSAPGTVRIEVEDNGVGIPQALRDRVFEPFFTTRPAGSGVGLDLSLAYEFIVQSNGGTITFETEEGRGTTFVVDLPNAGVETMELAIEG